MDESDPFRTVLSLIDSRNGTDDSLWKLVQKDEDLSGTALGYAKRNGLGYLFLERMKSLGFNLTPKNERELQKEKQGLLATRRTIGLLNDISEALDIDYVTIKMPYMIPHVPRDVDIFVPDATREEMIGSLTNRGMKSEHSSSVETTLRREGYAKVDVYSRICYFNFEFLDDGFFLKSRTYRPLFDIQSPVLEETASLVVELLHSLFGHRSMTLLDFLNMKMLMEAMGSVQNSRDVALKYGWGETFDLALEKLGTIQARIYDTGETIPFPYLYDRGFILECMSTIDGLTLNGRQKVLIAVSLLVDELILESKDSGLYEALRANESVRRLVNSVAHSVRIMRGDRKIS